jgi:PAS domain S-box-containing protein
MKSRLRDILAVLALTALYFAAGKFGLSLAFVHANASAVWPPTGIALAALLVGNYRLWPGILLGAFLVNITTQGSVATSLGIAVGNTLEAVAAAWLVQRFADGVKAFDRAQNVFKFIGLAAILSTVISATCGMTSLCLGGFARWDQFWTIWFTWWFGDVASNLIIAPLLIIWLTHPSPKLNAKRVIEAAGLLAAVALTGHLVFLGRFPFGADNHSLEYLAIPPLLWAAFRFGPRGAVTSAFIISGLALWGTLHGFGPFVATNLNESILLLQAFAGTITIIGLALAAVISERKRSEEVRSQLAAIVESSDDAVIGVTLEAVMTSWNKAAERIFQYQAEEVIGQPVSLLIPSSRFDEELGILERIKRGERVEHYETVRKRKDGALLNISLTVSPILNSAGTIIGASKIARDVSERNRSQEALRQAQAQLKAHASHLEETVAERTAKLEQAVQTLEGFSYHIAHDLRAPLRTMQGFSSILAVEHASQLDGPGKELLQRITDSAAHLQQLIQDLLEYGRLSHNDLPPSLVDLNTLLDTIIAQFAEEITSKGATVQLSPPFPSIPGNQALLEQILINLISNALKYVAPGVAPRVEIQSEVDESAVRIFVKDNGIGISPEFYDRIFRPFERLHNVKSYPGTGIGLAIVQKGMQRLGGSVTVESQVGKGSCFSLVFPKSKPSDPPSALSLTKPSSDQLSQTPSSR